MAQRQSPHLGGTPGQQQNYGVNRTASAPPAQSGGMNVPMSQGMPFMTAPHMSGNFMPGPYATSAPMQYSGTAGFMMQPGSFMGAPSPGHQMSTVPVTKSQASPVQPRRPKRVAKIEDDDGTVLNEDDIKATSTPAKEAPAASAAVPAAAPAPSPAPAVRASKAATIESPTPESPAAPAAAPKEAAPAPAPKAAPAATGTPVELLAAESTAQHPQWKAPVALTHDAGFSVDRSADGPTYTVQQLKTIGKEWLPALGDPAVKPYQLRELVPWTPALPAVRIRGDLSHAVLNEKVPRGRSSKAPRGAPRNRRQASDSSTKSGLDFAAARDPTVLLHSAGENSFTAQMNRERPHKEELLNEVTFILNKLARDTFDKLSKQILTVDIRSMDELQSVVGVIYDKALEFEKFQDLFADLCHQLTKSAAVWVMAFGNIVKHANGKYYADCSGDKQAADALAVGDDGKPASEFVLGPYATKDDAEKNMMLKCSFMRLLLNRAQQEFTTEVSFADIEEEAAKDAAEEEALKAAGKLTDADADRFQGAREERQLRHIVRKRRVLSNVSFIGQLYKVNIANAFIIDHCIMRLLNGGTDCKGVDEMDALAFCNLLAVVGSKLEADTSRRMWSNEQVLGFLDMLYKDKSHGSTVRFRALDVKEAAQKGWTFRDSHVANAKRTMTKDEFRKAEREKEMAKKVQELKLRQQAGGMGGSRGGGRSYDRGGIQDVRMASDATGRSRHSMRGSTGSKRPTRAGRATRPGAAAAGAGASTDAAEGTVLSGDALEKRVGSFFVDWGSNLRPEDRGLAPAELKDTPAGKEAVESFKEIAASPELGACLVSQAVTVLKESKTEEARTDAALLLSLAWAQERVKAADVVSGTAELMSNYKDYKAYDLPKVDAYLATLFAPLLAGGFMDSATLVRMTSQGTAFLAGTGLALLATIVAAAVAVEDSKFELDHSVSLWPLAGPSSFDVRGNTKSLAAAMAVPAVAAHPDAVRLQAMAEWRAATDRKQSADVLAAWQGLSADVRGASGAAAQAILQLMSDATAMCGGVADVEELKKFEDAIKAIAADGKAAGMEDFAGFLLEGAVRTVKYEAGYKAETHAETASAFVMYLKDAAGLGGTDVAVWKAASKQVYVSAEHSALVQLMA